MIPFPDPYDISTKSRIVEQTRNPRESPCCPRINAIVVMLPLTWNR